MTTSKTDLWKAAIEAFEEADHAVLELVCHRLLDHEADNFPVRMLLAHALLKMKRFPEAAELLEGANPGDERTVVLWHRTAGDYYAERGDYEAAEDEYATALALVEEQTSDLVLDLVETRISQGNSEAALRAIDTFRANNERAAHEDSELLAYAKARALRNLGRFEDALASAREAVGLGAEHGGFTQAEDLVRELERRLDWESKLMETDHGEVAQLDAE